MASFCSKCGNDVAGASFCPKCGSRISDVAAERLQHGNPQSYSAPSSYDQRPTYPPPYYDQPIAKEPTVHYAKGSFIEKFHNVGGSILFLVGIILFTAGNLFSFFMSFNWMSTLSMVMLALPVTGFWLIFAASKAPKMPEKVLPSLTLFKASTIIDLVLSCLQALLLFIVAIIVFVGASNLGGRSYASGNLLGLVGFLILLVGAGILVIGIIYFKAIQRVLNGLRSNIMYNTFHPLPGIKPFIVLTYIIVCAGALGTLVSSVGSVALSGALYSVSYLLPSELGGIVDNLLGGSAVDLLFKFMGYAGIIICIVALNTFNNELVDMARRRRNANA